VKLSVLVPVYNEEATVEALLERVLAAEAPVEKEIIVVDDGSTDGTGERLKEFLSTHGSAPVRLIRHQRNRGKGAAVRTALAAATGELAVVQDADLEYDPAEYGRLLEPILDGRADVVFGSRFLGGPHRVHLFWHYLGNKFLTTVCNALFNLALTDMETCYKAFRREVLDGRSLRAERYGFDPEITARFSQAGARIYEVPISYSGRTYAEGKKITWKDGLVVLWTLLRCRLGG
jgi:glycosyltransferase involved in cell wall biosynthesis